MQYSNVLKPDTYKEAKHRNSGYIVKMKNSDRFIETIHNTLEEIDNMYSIGVSKYDDLKWYKVETKHLSIEVENINNV